MIVTARRFTRWIENSNRDPRARSSGCWYVVLIGRCPTCRRKCFIRTMQDTIEVRCACNASFTLQLAGR